MPPRAPPPGRFMETPGIIVAFRRPWGWSTVGSHPNPPWKSDWKHKQLLAWPALPCLAADKCSQAKDVDHGRTSEPVTVTFTKWDHLKGDRCASVIHWNINQKETKRFHQSQVLSEKTTEALLARQLWLWRLFPVPGWSRFPRKRLLSCQLLSGWKYQLLLSPVNRLKQFVWSALAQARYQTKGLLISVSLVVLTLLTYQNDENNGDFQRIKQPCLGLELAVVVLNILVEDTIHNQSIYFYFRIFS